MRLLPGIFKHSVALLWNCLKLAETSNHEIRKQTEAAAAVSVRVRRCSMLLLLLLPTSMAMLVCMSSTRQSNQLNCVSWCIGGATYIHRCQVTKKLILFIPFQKPSPVEACSRLEKPPYQEECHILCPQSCILSSWSEWSPCQNSCSSRLLSSRAALPSFRNRTLLALGEMTNGSGGGKWIRSKPKFLFVSRQLVVLLLLVLIEPWGHISTLLSFCWQQSFPFLLLSSVVLRQHSPTISFFHRLSWIVRSENVSGPNGMRHFSLAGGALEHLSRPQ